jgi:toxin YoeB
MDIVFTPVAWEDYQHWQATDRAIVKRINQLLRDCVREPYAGIGKPEALKHHLNGCWSRRITDEHRWVYKIIEMRVVILQCRYHY